MRKALLMAAMALLTGCSWFGGDDGLEVRGPAVADLVSDLPEVATPEVKMPAPTRDEVMAAYEKVYGSIPDATINYEVGKRLADLEMEIGVESDIAGRGTPYQTAISMYESLLLESDGVARDAILYQLARAHDVVGQVDAASGYLDRLIAEYPDSEYIVEARFRRAEIAFSKDLYRDAGRDYDYVVTRGEQSSYWRNAVYMLGWCRFKTHDLDAGLENFFRVVDDIVAHEQDEPLGGGEQELLKDALRVIVLSVAYLDGPQTLAEHMDRLDRPAWQHRVYAQLASDYRDKERYLDSVATLETFIARNELDRRAPVFHQQAIDILIEADFPSEIRSRKEAFVTRYGIRSEFWTVHDDASRAEYLPTLKTYLDELSTLAHAEAQASGERGDYLRAADWYEQIVATFPDDPELAQHLFLLAEAYTEAGEDSRSIEPYQRVMREFPAYARAPEAGYAVILAHATLLEQADVADRELRQFEMIDSQIEFAMRFPADQRAATVQADAADSLYRLKAYDRAVEVAENLLAAQSDMTIETRRTALLVVGHGRFQLNQYAQAEGAYRSLLRLPADTAGQVDQVDQVDTVDTVDKGEITERLLASIYRQAEVAEAAGDPDTAVDHFLRLRVEAPASGLAIQGMYDAIAVVESQGDLLRAADLLDEFRASYPDSSLGADVDKRLADLYERSDAWDRAADEYSRIAAADPDPEVRGQALYRAAELYLEVEDLHNAIASFERYANDYPQPVGPQVEALQNLDELLARTGDEVRRRHWLQRKVQLADRLGPDASERLRFMAAEAQSVFAAEQRRSFDAVTLQDPLIEHMARKRDALQRSVGAYEKMAGYGVAQFATAATFEIADLYAALSRSLLESERPDGLSELELEQYEILLEEQAFPFEEQAIAIHEINMRRSWDGVYDESVQRSFAALRVLMPARFDKDELQVGYVESIH